MKKALLQSDGDCRSPDYTTRGSWHPGNQLSRSNVPDRRKDCLNSVFKVGSVETPRERIDIGGVVKQLHLARDKLIRCME